MFPIFGISVFFSPFFKYPTVCSVVNRPRIYLILTAILLIDLNIWDDLSVKGCIEIRPLLMVDVRDSRRAILCDRYIQGDNKDIPISDVCS